MIRRVPRPAPAAVGGSPAPLVTLTPELSAQRPARQPATATAAAPLDTTAYTQLRYRYIGPQGNRVASVTGVAGDPMTYYAGAASGGIFKSTDGGIHWSSIFDDQPVSSVGAMAVAPSDPNIVLAASGPGRIFKSPAGGIPWSSVFDAQPVSSVGAMAVAPSAPNIVWAGTGEP